MKPQAGHLYLTLWSLQFVHLPISACPHFGHGKVVSDFLTRRIPQDEQTFSWLSKFSYLGAEEHPSYI